MDHWHHQWHCPGHQLYVYNFIHVCVCNVCLEKEERLCLYCVYDMIFNVCSHHTLYNMQCETAMPGQPE